MTLHTHHSMKERGKADHEKKLAHHASGGKVSHETKAAIKRAIGEHDSQLHGGKHTHLKLARGGHVEGEHAKPRLDRASGGRTSDKAMVHKAESFAKSVKKHEEAEEHEEARERRADGGRTGGKKSGGGKHGTHINVIVAPGGGRGAAPPMGGVPPVPAAGAPPVAPRPPMPMGAPPAAGMGPPGMPPGGMPPRPPMGPPVGAGVPGMMRAKGGRVDMDAGGGSGLGRLEKIKEYGDKKLGENKSGETASFENRSSGTGKEKMNRGGRA